MANIKMIKAICDAFDEEMARDETVCLFGEDVGEFGGVFGTSQKLAKKYGSRRVFDTPLSESAIVGTAVGAAMTGLRPIAEIMYFDFITVAMDPLINQAAKLRHMSGGQVKMPLVIFAQFGNSTSEAAQHSQCLEAWFAHTPGLKVVMPSNVHDAKGLLKSAIRDDEPVVYLWHRMMYNLTEELPEEEYLIPLGKADIKRPGADITIVATSMAVEKSLKAAEELAPEINAEIIDLMTISPLDIKTILASVAKTGKLLIVHEAVTQFGIGAEIVRQVTEQAFDKLKAAPRVLGGANRPMPFAPALEMASLPQIIDIVKIVKEMV
jgi:acetoin:2,6-dichlorophenolindophenol oxidoreductase subunit beta